MAQQDITLSGFSGGISPNQKAGIANSCRFSKHLEIHEDINYATLKPRATKVSGSTVTDLVKWMDDGTPWDTNRWFYDSSGNIYKETSGGTWSQDIAGSTIANGAAGQGMVVFNDYLYYATSTTIGRKGRLSSSPTYNHDFLSDDTTTLDQSLDTSGNTYTLPSAISETATNRQTFTPARDSLKSVEVNVSARGTGNWTVTVHDRWNVSIGSLTIANASVAASGDQKFTFTSPLRVTIGEAYHFHVTSSDGTGTVVTTTASDLETADFHTYFGILIADTNWHPMIQHLNGVVIGNERYLAFWDSATYNPNKITFGPGFKVRALGKENEFVVAACWRGDNIDSVEEGRLYFWDGILSTFNYYKTITQGLPNAIHSSKSRLFGVYGSQGHMYVGTEPFKEIQSVPKLGRGKKVEVYPGAITEWLGQTMIGFSGSTDDSSGMEQGVYEFGNKQEGLPEVLNHAFTISTGTTQGTTLKIGMVKGLGKDLYIGWRDGSSYGVDKIIKTDSPATTGSWESLIFDDGRPQKTKLALKLVITFEALESGETVTPKYKVERATSFTTGTTVSTTGAVRAEMPLGAKRFREIEVGYNLTTSTTFPVITGVYFEYDDLIQEDNAS